jgi:hypothetical protein
LPRLARPAAARGGMPLLALLALLPPPLLAAAASSTHRLASEYIRVGLTVGETRLGGHTYLSELSLNQDLFSSSAGFGWTPNLVVNYSEPSPAQPGIDRATLSGTALVTWNGSAAVWHAPTGGTATSNTSGTGDSLTVAGIALGTAAMEEWQLTLQGPGLHWRVKRSMSTSLTALCDRMPTMIFNAEYTETGHVLAASAQIPSFLDSTLAWAPESGRGFVCAIGGDPAASTPPPAGGDSLQHGYWAEGVSNRTAQVIQLSPAGLQLSSVGGTTGSAGGALQFALSVPPSSPGVLGLGYTTITPAVVPGPQQPGSNGWWGMMVIVDRGAQYYVPPGNKTKFHFRESDCGATHCFCDNILKHINQSFAKIGSIQLHGQLN